MTTLLKANSEWSRRAPDERYSSIEAMHEAALKQREGSATVRLAVKDLIVKAIEGSVKLVGKTGRTAELTNWSFNQLANHAEAPAGYLANLPATLAADCLMDGLSKIDEEAGGKNLKLLMRQNGNLTARALTSERYSRIWNADITERLVELKNRGPWQEAPEAFDGSRGQYMSDRDMFSFFVDNNRRIFETDKNGGLSRGFFAWNSEVGARTFGVMTFLYEYVCGNHRVWGASDIKEVKIRHIGDAEDRAFSELQATLIEYADGAAKEDELKIKKARQYQIGGTKDEVIDAIFGLRLISRKTIDAAYQLAEKHEDWYGSPRSAWGMAGGLTEIARDFPNADERVSLDRASAKVMEMAW
jgi:hypothetical protein